jgi:DNA-binding Lrp family transcriptional regulator
MHVQRLEQIMAAKLLLSSKAQAVLRPFLTSNLTVGEAAKEIGLPINSVAYWVGKLFKHGILERVKTTPYPRYRATADAFFVPFSLAGKESFKAVYASIQAPILELFHDSIASVMNDSDGDWGVCISSFENDLLLTITDEARGGITLNSRQPDTPATVNLWGFLHLDFEDAKSMQHELIEVYQKYLQKSGAQQYLLRLGNVPMKR